MSDVRRRGRALTESVPGIESKSAEEIISDLAKPVAEPGSIVHEAYLAALQFRIAEMQRDTAKTGLRWARAAAISTITATVIALAAFLIAVL